MSDAPCASSTPYSHCVCAVCTKKRAMSHPERGDAPEQADTAKQETHAQQPLLSASIDALIEQYGLQACFFTFLGHVAAHGTGDIETSVAPSLFVSLAKSAAKSGKPASCEESTSKTPHAVGDLSARPTTGVTLVRWAMELEKEWNGNSTDFIGWAMVTEGDESFLRVLGVKLPLHMSSWSPAAVADYVAQELTGTSPWWDDHRAMCDFIAWTTCGPRVIPGVAPAEWLKKFGEQPTDYTLQFLRHQKVQLEQRQLESQTGESNS